MLAFGLNRLARGLRSSNPALMVFGAAVAAIGLARSRDTKRTLLYSKNLEPGEEISFRIAED